MKDFGCYSHLIDCNKLIRGVRLIDRSGAEYDRRHTGCRNRRRIRAKPYTDELARPIVVADNLGQSLGHCSVTLVDQSDTLHKRLVVLDSAPTDIGSFRYIARPDRS